MGLERIFENLRYFRAFQHDPSNMPYSKQDLKDLIAKGHNAAVIAGNFVRCANRFWG